LAHETQEQRRLLGLHVFRVDRQAEVVHPEFLGDVGRRLLLVSLASQVDDGLDAALADLAVALARWFAADPDVAVARQVPDVNAFDRLRRFTRRIRLPCGACFDAFGADGLGRLGRRRAADAAGVARDLLAAIVMATGQ